MADSMPSRRRWERRNVDVPARMLRKDGPSVAGHVQNIGEGGAFFTTDDLEVPFVEGSRVTIVLDDPGDTPLTIEGEILRVDTEFVADAVIRSLAIRFSAALPRGRFPFEPPPGKS